MIYSRRASLLGQARHRGGEGHPVDLDSHPLDGITFRSIRSTTPMMLVNQAFPYDGRYRIVPKCMLHAQRSQQYPTANYMC